MKVLAIFAIILAAAVAAFIIAVELTAIEQADVISRYIEKRAKRWEKLFEKES